MGEMKNLYITEMNNEMLCPICNKPLTLVKEKTNECSGVVPIHWSCEPCGKTFPMYFEMVENHKKALDKIWKHITGLKEFGNECKCNSSDNPDTSFDIIDYTGDAPSVNRWCLDCGGYRDA